MVIRNRFDLLYTTKKQKERSIKFMNQFVDYMSKMSHNENNSSLFEYSYYTSHTMEQELEKYSLNDLKYVMITFILFWIVYIILSVLDFDFLFIRIRLYLIKKITSKKTCSKLDNEMSSSKQNIDFFIKKNIFIPLMSIAQFFFTIIASLGLISLLGIEANQLLFSSIFVLMSIIFNLIFMFTYII